MTSMTVTMHRGVAVAGAVALLLAGAAAAYVGMRPALPAPIASVPDATALSSGAPPATSSATAPPADVAISLSKEAVERAGIVVTPVSSGGGLSSLRLPGIVEANAYRQVAVTPVVAGRVTHVPVQLGERVRRGQTMAQIFSPELADAQTRFVSARATLGAHDRELQRTEKLVAIGAASRQELERIHAEHTARVAELESARARLALLGASGSAAAAEVGNATTGVPAPIDGIVTERLANVGLNVDRADKLFTVVDLSTVWVMADLYERDFSRARVGDDATITTTAYPGLALRGHLTYIDPQVHPDTRTAKLRIEVPNAKNDLRLGMYAEVLLEGPAAAAVTVIPRSAVQNVGGQQVVYLVRPQESGTFTERAVRLGHASDQWVEVVSGLTPGDLVVTEGSFYLRAEAERLGLRGSVVSR